MRTRKLHETKLYRRNLIKGVKTWAVCLIRCLGPFFKWTRKELKHMNQTTRKPMTMHKVSHPREFVDGLYMSRKDGEKGFASIEVSVNATIQRLED